MINRNFSDCEKRVLFKLSQSEKPNCEITYVVYTMYMYMCIYSTVK